MKHDLVEELPHYGNDALFFQNDEITTGQLNNKTEIKIHLLTGQFLFFDNERGDSFLLTEGTPKAELGRVLERAHLKDPGMSLGAISREQLGLFRTYATRAKRVLELFRMRLMGHYTLVHLWPHNFDFSVEWFTDNGDEQVGIGISPSDKDYPDEYVYVNPYPFKDSTSKFPLPLGVWHLEGWKGIKAEWKDFCNLGEIEAADKLYDLFQLARKNFG